MEYYDTDSIFYDLKKFNQPIDNFKIVRPTAEEKLQMKLYLNSLYGKAASCIHFTDGKENDKMTRDYIVVHDDGEPMIIFKEQIVGISKNEDGACIYCTNGCYYVDESYASVVKQIV